MKKLISKFTLINKIGLGLGLVTLVFAVSCTSSVDPVNAIDEAAVQADLIAQADFEEIDDMTSEALGLAGDIGGRVEGMHDERMKCAVVTHDIENQVITIDFGDGCEGPNGVIRSGIIIINYDGRRFIPGSTWVISFENFYINDRHIEGVRTVSNISESLESNPTFHIILEDGKVTWPDETFATREVDQVRVWIRATNPVLDEYHVLAESRANGLNRDGVSVSCLVVEDLIYKRECRGAIKGRIPVAGVKEVTVGEKVYTIDFGNGECDTMVDVTYDGVTRSIDLSDR